MEQYKGFLENWYQTHLGGYESRSQLMFKGPFGLYDVLSYFEGGMVLLPGQVKLVHATQGTCVRFNGKNIAIKKNSSEDLMFSEFTDFSQNAQRTEGLDVLLREVRSHVLLAAGGVRLESLHSNVDIYWDSEGFYLPQSFSYMRFKEHLERNKGPRKLITPRKKK